MRTDTDVARGAAAGAVGAATWAAQQPLDKRVFGSDYDDVELLGKLVTVRRWWPLPGLAVHIANGALFGAAYALARSHLPGPGWARGLLAAQVENFGLWPLVRFTDHYHPARDEWHLRGNVPVPALGLARGMGSLRRGGRLHRRRADCHRCRHRG